MNKTAATLLKICIGTILVAGILVGVYYGVTYYSDANRMAEILKIGNDCMATEDYLGAIEAYHEALVYDKENADVKTTIAHAYVKLGGLYGESDEAVDAYQNALQYDATNRSAYWGVANIFEARGDEDNMLVALNTGFDNTGDENMRAKADRILEERERIRREEEEQAREEAELAAIKEAHDAILSKVFERFETGKLDDVKEVLRMDEVKQLADEIVSKETSFYYGEEDADGNRNGKGLAVYMDGYYYYGSWKNNVRSGKGIWMRAVYTDASAMGSFIYDGEWSDDAPNGRGSATSNFYKDKISDAELVKQVITGEYSNGCENGKMELNGVTKSGKSVRYQYTAADGIAEKSGKEDSGIKGQYVIAKSSDGKSNLTSDGSKRGVEGFLESM